MKTKYISLFLVVSALSMASASASHNGNDQVQCDGDGPINKAGDLRTVEGKDLADCSVGDSGESRVIIVQQHDGSLVGTVTTQSFGDSWPTNCYDVAEKAQGAVGAPRVYFGKDFKLTIDVDVAPSKDGIPGRAYAPQSMASLNNHKVECTLK